MKRDKIYQVQGNEKAHYILATSKKDALTIAKEIWDTENIDSAYDHTQHFIVDGELDIPGYVINANEYLRPNSYMGTNKILLPNEWMKVGFAWIGARETPKDKLSCELCPLEQRDCAYLRRYFIGECAADLRKDKRDIYFDFRVDKPFLGQLNNDENNHK